ncbi:drug/metabolite transporter (DMT)-like permease [Nitrospirillum amazonense]|uniref:Drug/metabolite transporter (DMT)-like permease n=1 Tax=Nitrospirillum amazonense TaxID=28077 RepID=A0A560FAY8_9PROT|nr:DMT family transporter [Nitrospirillum amazonense]TWB18725.1 drug/metabolite transporter (DMT)-like permease [Nitrospirillum amazonense]
MRSAYLSLTAAMVLVGLSVPISKMAVTAVPPLVAADVRFALAALALSPWAIRHGRRALPATGGDWASLALLSLFGMVLFNVFLMYGLRGTSATTAGILTSTIPAVTALCAAAILRERLTLRNGAAIALAMAGIAALNLASHGAHGADGGAGDTLRGNALVLGAVVSEGLYNVYARRLAGVSPLAVTFLANLMAAVLALPFAVLTARGMTPESLWGGLSPGAWALYAAASLGNGLVAVVFWLRGAARIPASRSGLFTGLLPVTVLVPSLFLLGERPTLAHALGLAGVLAGIAVGVMPGRNRPATARPQEAEP